MARKKPARGPPPPEPIETPFTNFDSKEPFFYEVDQFPKNSMVLLFRPLTDAPFTSNCVRYLRARVEQLSAVIFEELCGPTGYMFIIGLHQTGETAFLRFLSAGPVKSPATDQLYEPLITSIKEQQQVCITEFELPYLTLLSSGEDISDYSQYDIKTLDSDDEDNLPIGLQIKKAKVGTHLKSPAPSDKLQTEPTAAATSTDPIGSEVRTGARAALSVISTSAPACSSMRTEERATQDELPATTQEENMDIELQSPVKAKQNVKRPRNRVYRHIDFNNITVNLPPQEPATTVLLRPVDPANKLKDIHPAKFVTELAKLGKTKEIRDIRNGGVAIDFVLETNIQPILELTSICEIPVTASLPVGVGVVSGVLQNVHWDLTEQEIKENSTCIPEMQITSATRLAKPQTRSWTVKVTFSGSKLPERVLLFDRSYPVKPLQNRPIQCRACGRFGHVDRVCRSSLRCPKCSEPHKEEDCLSTSGPKCANCGGPHIVTSNECPAKKMQNKICQVKNSHQITFKKARTAVTSAVKSYSQALKTKQTGGPNFVPNPNRNPTFATRLGPQQEPSTSNQDFNDQGAITNLCLALHNVLLNVKKHQNFQRMLQELANVFQRFSAAPQQQQ